MQYKTIVLQLIRQRPKMRKELRRNRTMLKTVESYAEALKQYHQAWMEELSRINPDRDLFQITSEALAIALEDLGNCFPPESRRDPSGTFSLDEAMTFIRRRTPPA